MFYLSREINNDMKQSNRRKFIGTAAAAGAGLYAGKAAAMPAAAADLMSAGRPPIVHHVFFWLNDPSSTADRDKVVEGLKTLAKIPLIKELYVGVLANTEKRDVVDASWQVSELMFFDDLTSQASYQQHPIHLEFVKNCSHLWKKVVVYDVQNVFPA
jgi:hypothetical protein